MKSGAHHNKGSHLGNTRSRHLETASAHCRSIMLCSCMAIKKPRVSKRKSSKTCLPGRSQVIRSPFRVCLYSTTSFSRGLSCMAIKRPRVSKCKSSKKPRVSKRKSSKTCLPGRSQEIRSPFRVCLYSTTSFSRGLI